MGKNVKMVLIIDDGENITGNFTRIHRKKATEADTAKNGKQAVEKTTAKCSNVALI